MVLEDILEKIGKRKVYAFLLGILYVMISYGTALAFFPNSVSLAMIFLTTLLLVPSSAKLIGMEESVERRDGLNRFFRDHYILMEIFLFLFIGIFIGYLIIGSYRVESLDYQKVFLEKQGININSNIEKFTQFRSVLINNTSVVIISFVLSLFYGVGALFLTVLNASIFSGFLLNLSSQSKTIGAALLSLHFIPEVFGFLLAAMAGGVISKAITKERVGSIGFKNVIKDGTLLLWFSLLVIVIAALIEVYLTPGIARPFL